MITLLRRLFRLRGPAGVLALAVGAGAFTGLVATHVVLAVWTYRDAAGRDLREPGRWALAVLVGGLFVFVPYVLLQTAVDWSSESRTTGTVRWAVRRARGDPADEAAREAVAAATEEAADAAKDAAADATTDAADAATDATAEAVEERVAGRRGGSLAVTAARYGWKATRLAVRGGRWAGRRVVARASDR